MSKTKKYSFADHPEHEARLDAWAKKWIAVALRTRPRSESETKKLKAAIHGLYSAANLEPPKHIICPPGLSPMGAAIAATIASCVWWLRENLNEHVRLFGRSLAESELTAAIRPACEIATKIGQSEILGTPRPAINVARAAVGRDDRNRPHCADGPQLAWADGWRVYYIHGVRVPMDIVEDPKSITVERIDKERNAEIRRVMIEKYGIARYLQDSNAEVLDEDKDLLGQPRKLVRKERPGDEPIVVCFVKNSSLEPDGSRKDYMIRCHPELRPLVKGQPLGEPQKMTCHNAIAASFGMRGEHYKTVAES